MNFCPKLELDFYNITFNQNIEEWVDIPTKAKESLSFIPKLPKLKAVVYFKLKTHPKLSINDTHRRYDVTYEQSYKAHKCFRSMKAYKVETIKD